MAHCSFIEARVQCRFSGISLRPFKLVRSRSRIRIDLSFVLLSASFKRTTHCQCAPDAVLVKSVPPVGPAERRPIHVDHFMMPGLSSRTFRREDRVVVDETPQHFRGVDRFWTVERHVEDVPRANVLEDIHAIRDGRVRRSLARQVIVPARPGATAAGQHRCLGVQQGDVPLIRKRAQELTLDRPRICQNPKRLVAVAGKNDVIDRHRPRVSRGDEDPVRASARPVRSASRCAPGRGTASAWQPRRFGPPLRSPAMSGDRADRAIHDFGRTRQRIESETLEIDRSDTTRSPTPSAPGSSRRIHASSPRSRETRRRSSRRPAHPCRPL